MNREILMAAACAAATIALAWLVDHPAKVGGSLITLVAFGIIAVAVKIRGSSTSRLNKWNRGRHDRTPSPEETE